MWENAVRYLRDRAYEVRVLASDFRRAHVTSQSESDVFRELQWYWRDDEWPWMSPLRRLDLERRNARTFARHVEEFAPDLVCWWAMGGMSLSLIEQAPRSGLGEAFVVCDDWLLYGPDVDAWQRMARRLGPLRGLLRAVSGIAVHVDRERSGGALFPSRTLARRALAAGWRFAEVDVCHQGVPRKLFSPRPPRDWGWELACVGRLDPRKGTDLAIEALAWLPAASRLRIVGGGDDAYRRRLMELAEELGVAERVSFEERSRAGLVEVYAGCDAILFPVRWDEPWGLVPLEAMAVGRPVVATGRGGSAEYLEDGRNCLLFDPDRGGAPALAAAINGLAHSPSLRAELRAGGLATVARFGEQDFDEAVERLVQRAASA